MKKTDKLDALLSKFGLTAEDDSIEDFDLDDESEPEEKPEPKASIMPPVQETEKIKKEDLKQENLQRDLVFFVKHNKLKESQFNDLIQEVRVQCYTRPRYNTNPPTQYELEKTLDHFWEYDKQVWIICVLIVTYKIPYKTVFNLKKQDYDYNFSSITIDGQKYKLFNFLNRVMQDFVLNNSGNENFFYYTRKTVYDRLTLFTQKLFGKRIGLNNFILYSESAPRFDLTGKCQFPR